MTTVLRAQGLTKSFRDAGRCVEVLKGADIEVRQGEMVAVVGLSGSGKSTLLHLIGGLDTLDSGEIKILDRDWSTLGLDAKAEARNKLVGFIFQFHQLLPDFTALENVVLPGRIGGQDPRELNQRAVDLLNEVGLAHRLEHYPTELSGGEKQRVALCRALIQNPPLLLADEPTGNLDHESGERVFSLLEDMVRSRSTALVLVTHNRELAGRCGRILELENGRLRSPSNPIVDGSKRSR